MTFTPRDYETQASDVIPRHPLTRLDNSRRRTRLDGVAARQLAQDTAIRELAANGVIHLAVRPADVLIDKRFLRARGHFLVGVDATVVAEAGRVAERRDARVARGASWHDGVENADVPAIDLGPR